MSQVITLDMLEPDVACLTFNDPERGANVFSQGVLAELESHLDALASRTDLAGLVIRSAKPGIFIAGADLREFVASLDIEASASEALCRRGQTLFMRLAEMPFVTVAAIHGICVGGGAEMAAWCDRRIMTDHRRTQIGWPEVKLGLIPGWGGTVRASRLAGLANAVELITTGNTIDARRATQIGLCDIWVAPEQLEAETLRMIRREASSRDFEGDRKRWAGPIPFSETELGFLGLTASAMIQAETKGHYPAPEAALEVLLEGSTLDADGAARREAAAMADLFGSPVNAALLNVFFLTDRNKKDRGIEGQVEPTAVERVGVVGAGIMGTGIAAANVKRGVAVWLADADPRALAKGLEEALQEASYDRHAKGPTAKRLQQNAPRLNAVVDEHDYGACDLVIEAIVENEQVKKQVLPAIERRLGADGVLATNTSTIPITRLAESLERPERFCGIHFFNPVRRMQLVEVIRGEATSDETVATAVAYAKRLGKMPIVLKDGPGFLVNRLLLPYMNEAIELLLDGVSIDAVERAAKRFGMPMGPITLYDVVGLDTALFAGRVLWEAFPDRIPTSPLLMRLVKAGRLGQKSGRGFFRYDGKKRKPLPDPELDTFLEPLKREPRELTAEQITRRLFLPMLLEATRVIEEKLIRDVRDIDLGLIFGIGFPAFRGGLLFWADTVGAASIREQLAELEYLGPRAAPTPLLDELADQHRTFYSLTLD